MIRLPSMVFAALICVAAGALADDTAPPQTQHQMMKDCMAKQKASDGGMPKEQMKKTCKDVTKTAKENEKAEKSGKDSGNPPAASPPR